MNKRIIYVFYTFCVLFRFCLGQCTIQETTVSPVGVQLNCFQGDTVQTSASCPSGTIANSCSCLTASLANTGQLFLNEESTEITNGCFCRWTCNGTLGVSDFIFAVASCITLSPECSNCSQCPGLIQVIHYSVPLNRCALTPFTCPAGTMVTAYSQYLSTIGGTLTEDIPACRQISPSTVQCKSCTSGSGLLMNVDLSCQ